MVASCCDATPAKIPLRDIDQDPLDIFNFPIIMQERKEILENKRIAGCEQCWQLEDHGLQSRRLLKETNKKVSHDIYSTPKQVVLTLNNTCNLTCSYCNQTYSHSWLDDLIKNGDYNLPGQRYNLTAQDRIVHQLSQKDLHQSQYQTKIIDQLLLAKDSLTSLTILGGEPMLNNQLISIVEKFESVPVIEISTGLGVNYNRLENICNQLKNFKNVKFIVSAENTAQWHEFNRYGSTYNEWLKNFKLIESLFDFNFNCVISNTTIFDLPEFLKTHRDHSCKLTLLVHPDFLSVSNLDQSSKDQCIQQLQELSFIDTTEIVNHINHLANLDDVPVIRQFLNTFAQRRNLDLSIFPKSFIEWINQPMKENLT
jgi:organic radical activating enzyme